MSGTTSLTSLPAAGPPVQSHTAAQANGAMQLSIDNKSSSSQNIPPAEASALVRSVQEASQGGGLSLPPQHSPQSTEAHSIAPSARPAPPVPATTPAPMPIVPRVAAAQEEMPAPQPTWIEQAQGPVIAFAAYLLFQTPALKKWLRSSVPGAHRPDGRLTTGGHVLNASLFGLLTFAISQIAERCS